MLVKERLGVADAVDKDVLNVPRAKEPTTRDKLVEVARQLFLAKGYEATGIAEILREAGVNSGSLYYFFKTKEDLLLAVLDLVAAAERHRMAHCSLTQRQRLDPLDGESAEVTRDDDDVDFIELRQHVSAAPESSMGYHATQVDALGKVTRLPTDDVELYVGHDLANSREDLP